MYYNISGNVYEHDGYQQNLHLIIELPEETPKYEFKVGDLVRHKDNKNHTGAIYEIIGIEGNVATLQNIFKAIFTHSLDVLEHVEEKKQHEFKPFDKVLVREDKEKWSIDFFSHYSIDGTYACSGGVTWKQCILFDGNEHLLGTT